MGDMALSKEEVMRLAELSRLELSDDEAMRMERTIDPVLSYVGRLSQVDTAGVPEQEEIDPGLGLRSDVVEGCPPEVRTAVIANFPDKLGDALRVPGVFERPKG